MSVPIGSGVFSPGFRFPRGPCFAPRGISRTCPEHFPNIPRTFSEHAILSRQVPPLWISGDLPNISRTFSEHFGQGKTATALKKKPAFFFVGVVFFYRRCWFAPVWRPGNVRAGPRKASRSLVSLCPEVMGGWSSGAKGTGMQQRAATSD